MTKIPALALLLVLNANPLVQASVATSPSPSSPSPPSASPPIPQPHSSRHGFVFSDTVAAGAFHIILASEKLILSKTEVAERTKDPSIIILPLPASSGSSKGPQMYMCSLPPRPASARTTALPPVNHAAEKSRVSQTLNALSGMAGTCISYTQGWWAYKYCHDLHVQQYHHAPQPPPPGSPAAATGVLQYSLGKPVTPPLPPPPPHHQNGNFHRASAPPPPLPPSPDDPFLAPALIEFDDEGRHFLRLRWAEGTMCSLTGKPRQTEIQFYCCSSEHISSVREMAVCSYAMIIHTHRVCDLPWFKGRPAAEAAAADDHHHPASAIVCQALTETVVLPAGSATAGGADADANANANAGATTPIAARVGSHLPIQRSLLPRMSSGEAKSDQFVLTQLRQQQQGATTSGASGAGAAADAKKKIDTGFPRNAPLEMADALYDEDYDPVQDLLDSVLYMPFDGEFDDGGDEDYYYGGGGGGGGGAEGGDAYGDNDVFYFYDGDEDPGWETDGAQQQQPARQQERAPPADGADWRARFRVRDDGALDPSAERDYYEEDDEKEGGGDG
ncbi:Protein OS-9 [Geranomyces variabilis]|uniref:Protein OS-9 homolog n=1 Tax=Geranomyces variabilis TaxID=109894 RepID=A0AAD5TQ12_9FUNG|nr:Protein OS-9 [Geranomyces variabilis]